MIDNINIGLSYNCVKRENRDRNKTVIAREVLLRDVRREKHNKKKGDERKCADLRENYGFSDTQRVSLCDICGRESDDVYRYRIESDSLRARITGYPVRGVCPNCYKSYDEQGIRMVSVGEDKPVASVYDASKPRNRLF